MFGRGKAGGKLCRRRSFRTKYQDGSFVFVSSICLLHFLKFHVLSAHVQRFAFALNLLLSLSLSFLFKLKDHRARK
jgi:hypothetical protein